MMVGIPRTPIRRTQQGQSIVEYTVILAFGFLVLIAGDDILQATLEALHNNYKGYSYAVSVADIPDYDNLYEFGMSTPEAELAEARLGQLMDVFDDITAGGFPDLPTFDDIAGNVIPDSPADFLDGAGQFFPP